MSPNMSKKIHRMGSRNYAVDNADLLSLPRLESDIYDLGLDSMGQIYAVPTHNMVLPKKLYGEIPGRCDRILKTHQARQDKNTGVVLYGDKGSGKTLLAKQIMIKAMGQGIPSILVNNNIETAKIIWFINNLSGPKVIMFDEFEKNYRGSTEQEEWLSLLDGTGSVNNLFIFTTNSQQLSSYLDNRPGRVFYKIGYQGLETSVIREFVDENIKEALREHGEKIKNLACLFHEKFNFDMLAAWVEEVNRYEESPLNALRYLNISLFYEAINVDAKVTVNGQVWQSENIEHDGSFDFASLQDEYDEQGIALRRTKTAPFSVNISYKDCELVKSNYVNGEFVFRYNHAEWGEIVIELNRAASVERQHPLAKYFETFAV